jgi:hypothetical protein
MAYTYEDLKKKTIADLREIAKGIDHDAVKGYTQMNKDHLLPALCKALAIDSHAHHAAEITEKSSVKARMRELRDERAKALDIGDHEHLHQIRREYHGLNHSLRSSAKHATTH